MEAHEYQVLSFPLVHQDLLRLLESEYLKSSISYDLHSWEPIRFTLVIFESCLDGGKFCIHLVKSNENSGAGWCCCDEGLITLGFEKYFNKFVLNTTNIDIMIINVDVVNVDIFITFPIIER